MKRLNIKNIIISSPFNIYLFKLLSNEITFFFSSNNLLEDIKWLLYHNIINSSYCWFKKLIIWNKIKNCNEKYKIIDLLFNHYHYYSCLFLTDLILSITN